jgi:hypothetical protein
MRTASESPITLSGKSLIGSQQGTMHFMSVEVAAENFLFRPPPSLSLSLDELDSALDRDGPATVPFSHNHLHDLESLWWVAVWIDFYYHFSKKETPPSLTLKDAEKQLRLAQTLFPPVRDSNTRLHGFQTKFQEKCHQLPKDIRPFGADLDRIRRLLIIHYNAVEAKFPESVDLDSSTNDIYDGFRRVFSEVQSKSHDLELNFLPNIQKELLKKENLKRPRSRSTNDAEGASAPKSPRT